MIGANSNETDVAELMAMAARERANEEGSEAEESNEEGMGDIDFEQDAAVAEEDSGEDEEEKKE